MAARKTYVREGVTLKRTIGGYAGRIGGSVFTFRRDGANWRVTGQMHKARPLSDLPTLTDAVLWVKGHLTYCSGGCSPDSGPFDSVRVEPSSRASDDCHTFS